MTKRNNLIYVDLFLFIFENKAEADLGFFSVTKAVYGLLVVLAREWLTNGVVNVLGYWYEQPS